LSFRASDVIGRSAFAQRIPVRTSANRPNFIGCVRRHRALAVPVDDCPCCEQARRSRECQLVDGNVEERWRQLCGLEPNDKPYHSGHAHRSADDEKQLANP
jgi:hypothetical protein